MKDSGTALIFWLLGLLGLCGLHRLYTGRIVTGLIWLFTGGLCLIGQIVDVFLLDSMVRQSNLEQQRYS